MVGVQPKCLHLGFEVQAVVNRITNDDGKVERYNLELTVKCQGCGIPFRFIGLPAGLDLTGAATSVDACEARLCIAPKGEVLSAMEGAPHGFSVKRVSP